MVSLEKQPDARAAGSRHVSPVLSDVAECTPVMLMAVDSECRITQANTATGQFVAGDPVGRRFCEVFRAQTCDAAAGTQCFLGAALRGLERRANPRWVTLTIAGTPRSVLLKATTLNEGAGRARSPLGAAVTIIPSNLVDDADRRRREMIAAAVHDLRHPVTIQSLALDMLSAHAPSMPSEARPLLDKMRRSTAYLSGRFEELLERMLFDLHAQVLRPQLLEIRPVVEDIAGHMQPLLDRRGQTTSIRCAPYLNIWADRASVEHMLHNLLLNAHKYSIDQDVIAVSARTVPERGAVELTVRDHGPGVPPSERRRIFERFYRGGGSESQNGAGLGLAIVFSLAVQQGGSAGVRRARGGGATFWIQLPSSVPGHSKLQGANVRQRGEQG